MLKPNTSDSFPGADYVAADPVSAEECCLHQSVAAMIVALRAADKPFIMRGGRLYFDQAGADLLTMCSGAAPTISGIDPLAIVVDLVSDITCTGAGAVEGEVWLGSANTWAGSGVKVEQNVQGWADTSIGITGIRGALPAAPTKVYCYVFNACDRGNVAGFECTIQDEE